LTKKERDRVSELVRATEFIFLENIALKLILEHRRVPNWRKLLDRLLSDEEMLAGLHLRFRDVQFDIKRGGDAARSLQILVERLPSRKPQ